ncbi:FimV/HubP family polar landmark protein [Castellaniella hirudinis]|uniref:FimV/HubP family polar landmark protein n=1 Tax=Castellaniella hirudinis TaxID=1144617 RepID=UPI0039C12AA0
MPRAAHLAGGILALAFLFDGAAQAASFGHARLLSAAGAPLAIRVPIQGLSSADLQALSVRPAPAADWAAAGLTPPVALDHLRVSVEVGAKPSDSRVLRVDSSLPFVGGLADLLLEVQTAAGRQRYQVSILAPGPVQAPPAAPARAVAGDVPAAAVEAAPAPTSRRVPAGAITIHGGDTMWRVARRHAVDQVTIYQLMMALQRANPQAFIHDNINLLRTGAVLTMPSRDDMLSISDAEARRQFVAQTAAFNRLRGTLAASTAAPPAGQGASGPVSTAAPPTPRDASSAGDRLQLSQGSSADADAARGHALKDAESRVGQLQDNVQNLNQALQAQGEAARSAVVDGAKAVTESIDKIAGAISQASQEAASQADARLEAGSADGGGAGPADAAAPSASSSAAGAGSSPDPAASPSGVPPGQATGSPDAQPQDGAAHGPADAPANGATAAPSAAAAAGGAAAPTDAGAAASSAGAASTATQATAAQAMESRTSAQASGAAASAASRPGSALGTAAGPGLAAASAAPADDAAVSIPAPSVKTEHRVSWIQDHLLAVMSGLLAFIVLLIAWLLRRANLTRDAADAGQVVTDAMVREKLQGVDLDLPVRDAPRR